MTEHIPKDARAFNTFIDNEKPKVLAYLRKNFSLSDDDIEDIYQESSLALYKNISEGRLKQLTSSLSTYFLRICINQTLTFTSKKKKVVPFINESNLTGGIFDDDKLDELYNLSTFDESEEYCTRMDAVVDKIVEMLPETCRNIFGGYYWQNLSTKVIADMFGYANANTVKAQKYKCVDKFKRKFNELMKICDE